ncbi:MAG: hypothetical protein RRB22_03440 [Gammaproteobacteria bacterium]|nr:hypothetical protein [Gammaproteobacteria bacterium]
MDLNSLERETIGLCICLEAVNDIVNHVLLDVWESSQSPGVSMVYFKDRIHRSLFVIRFLDFAKEAGDSKLTGISGSCINVLNEACSSKRFNIDNSVEELERSLVELQSWLELKTPLKLWLPTLNLEAKLEVSRIEFLKISGNHSKHNISRLTGVSKGIHKILSEHNYNFPLELIPLALEDFREHLDENYFIYYGTWMAELLNNVRWGLQRYLKPIYHSCLRKGEDGISYKYEYPEGFESEVSKQWFWRLMNHVRTGPYVKHFSSPIELKDKSSLERG